MKKLTQQEFIEKASKVHGDRFDYSETVYNGANSKILIICPEGHKVLQNPNDHLRGNGCKECKRFRLGEAVKRPLSEIKNLLKQKYRGRYEYDFTGYRNLNSIINITCKPHGTKPFRVKGLLEGYECTECKKTKTHRVTLEYFLRKCKTVHGSFYSYDKVEFTQASSKVTITCKKHGDFLQGVHAHLGGQGCPKCKMSKGETKIRLWLEQNKYLYMSQFKFQNSRYKFDFYIPEKNICIEYDGEFHYVDCNRGGGKTGLELRKQRDRNKTALCEKEGVKLIRIPYWEYKKIGEILTVNLC